MPDPTSWTIAVLPQVAAALALLIAGAWIARWAERSLTRIFEHHRVLDPTFRGVLTSLIRYSILLLAAVAALQQLGIQTASILAAVGAVLLAVGLALQGTLSNIAAGLMLLWLRPFRVGDTIETASVAGTVSEVGLFATEVLRGDGVYVFVPNSDLWNKPVSKSFAYADANDRTDLHHQEPGQHPIRTGSYSVSCRVNRTRSQKPTRHSSHRWGHGGRCGSRPQRLGRHCQFPPSLFPARRTGRGSNCRSLTLSLLVPWRGRGGPRSRCSASTSWTGARMERALTDNTGALMKSSDAYKAHPGTFNRAGNTITYSYESTNGRANVMVMRQIGCQTPRPREP